MAIGLTLAGLGLLAWVASGAPNPFDGRPPPVPEVRLILDRAAEDGIYAYDGVSAAASLPARELLEGHYVMTTTEPRLDARPDFLVKLPSAGECVRYARVLADLNADVGFCEPLF
ncbi:hypothetical protein [Rubellimicrobium aerolatum]|uniref:Uncharacterized protein n=1 Tax=Rubellimicrobium aerolatum TaxID=490979 RepID=A0ABW0S7Z1_9RHOB|nr:hypothetical protein [Rubellimicrobium aerolatum]MBP1804419.1 hypothetical protein [Rubellimicrobium aerolatum]